MFVRLGARRLLQLHEVTYGLIIVNLMSHSQWIYAPSDDGIARFMLGTEGQNPLICFGINPSTAVPGKLDPTVTRVRNIAARNQFDSWLMLNIYPQISTDPKGIHHVFEPALKNENERHIEQLLSGRSLTILGAWGSLIDSRNYFHSLLADVVKVTDAAGCRWVSLGKPLVNGHPRHPSRARNDLLLESFDMVAYLS